MSMTNIYGGYGITCTSSNNGPGITGQVRYNGNTSQFEVNDGVSWRPIMQSTSVNIDYTTQQVIEWASKKMKEEQELTKLRNAFPAIDEAAKEVELAQTTLDAVKALCSGPAQ